MLLNLRILFSLSRHKIVSSSCHFFSESQSKTIKLLNKRFERSMYWNEYKTENENKNTTNKYRCFIESNFVGVKRFFVLVYSNKDDNAKRSKTRRYYLPKVIIKNYNVIINRKTFNDQVYDSNIKRHKEIRKLTNGQGEYTTGCLLGYDYVKNYYRLIAVALRRQMEFDRQLKNPDDVIAANESMFVLTILEIIKEKYTKQDYSFHKEV